jgi:hypothetical protein
MPGDTLCVLLADKFARWGVCIQTVHHLNGLSLAAKLQEMGSRAAIAAQGPFVGETFAAFDARQTTSWGGAWSVKALEVRLEEHAKAMSGALVDHTARRRFLEKGVVYAQAIVQEHRAARERAMVLAEERMQEVTELEAATGVTVTIT